MALTRPIAPDPTGVKSELLANFLFEQLVGEANATLPEIDLTDAKYTVPWDSDNPIFNEVSKVTIEELVGYFNSLMGGVAEHIGKEFTAGRITGAKYADVYLALMQSSMQSAVQFALGKDQAFWMAAKTQADAITAGVQNEVAKLSAMLARAQYALTKLKLSTEDSQFGQSEYQRTDILPLQKTMVEEQANSQRAQTLDERLDSAPVAGVLGTQKLLYTQQVKSYKDDTQLKATRIFADLWTTQKTITEDWEPSGYFGGYQTVDGKQVFALDKVFKDVRILALDGTDDGFTPE